MNVSSHPKRVLTALILLPLLAGVLYLGYSAITVLIVLVALLGLWEFYSLFWAGMNRFFLKCLGCLAGTLFLLDFGLEFTGSPILFLVLLSWIAWLTFLVEYSRHKDKARLDHYLILLSGIVYVPLVLSLMLTLSIPEIILVLAATFASDIGAFYSGSLWGEKKIWPAVSPKKTWMGSLGGLVLCVAVTMILGPLLGTSLWWHYLILGILLNISAQLGDFFQSSLKRWTKVKDTGQILPGHGGILDRIDSLLLLLPVYVLYSSIIAIF